jgi:hypothetical protein
VARHSGSDGKEAFKIGIAGNENGEAHISVLQIVATPGVGRVSAEVDKTCAPAFLMISRFYYVAVYVLPSSSKPFKFAKAL